MKTQLIGLSCRAKSLSDTAVVAYWMDGRDGVEFQFQINSLKSDIAAMEEAIAEVRASGILDEAK